MRPIATSVTLLLMASSLLLSCTSSNPAPTSSTPADSATADSAPSGTCSLVAGSCVAPSGICCRQAGILFDEARGCLTKTQVAIGCVPSPIPKDSACVDLGIVGCAITNDSGIRRVWFTPSLAVGWTAAGAEGCPDGLMEKFFATPRCPDDAGP